MSVDDWAREQSEAWYPTSGKQSSRWNAMQVQGQGAANRMARHLADALLSDEAVEAARIALAARGFDVWESGARIALEAAVRAVTEGGQ